MVYWLGYFLCYAFAAMLSKGVELKNKYVLIFFFSALSWVGALICVCLWVIKEKKKLVEDLDSDL